MFENDKVLKYVEQYNKWHKKRRRKRRVCVNAWKMAIEQPEAIISFRNLHDSRCSRLRTDTVIKCK